MQKTAVIYGLALSTLVGAFFLAPRLQPAPEPEPEPIPVHHPTPSVGPLTELIYSDGSIEVTARLDRGYLSAASTEPVWMDVAIKASGVNTRAPLTTVLVVDRSGSMAGDKIDQARMAAERFVSNIREGDQLAIVTFGTDVTVELPLTVIDSGSRSRALQIVRRIEEGGGTNIDGGMTSARHILASADLSGRVGRVILMSDGRPTEGDRRESVLAGHTAKLRESGVVTSTLGLGLDYNEDLMERMAVDGGGRYHYMRHGNQMAQILTDELEQASAVVASNVKIYMPRELNVLDVPGARYSRGDRVAIDVGDLAAGEERHILVKVQAPALSGDVATFLAPEIVYRKPAEKADALLAHRADPFRMMATTDMAALDGSRRDDVRVRVLQVEASLALTASMRAYASGDASKARAQLVEKKAELADMAARTKNGALAAEAANFDRVLNAVSAAPAAAGDDAQDMIKEQKARAFSLRR